MPNTLQDTRDFQALYRQNKWRTTVDVLGHVVFAIVIGKAWYMQAAPDVFIPLLFYKSWRSGVLLPEDCWVIHAHRFLHTIWPVFLLVGGGLLVSKFDFAFWAGIQWLAHVLWDQLTHSDQSFKKSLVSW